MSKSGKVFHTSIQEMATKDVMDAGNVKNQVSTRLQSFSYHLKNKVHQVLCALVASLSSLVSGTLTGLSSTLIYSVVHGTEGLSATLEEASWISREHIRKSLVDVILHSYSP